MLRGVFNNAGKGYESASVAREREGEREEKGKNTEDGVENNSSVRKVGERVGVRRG